MRRQNDHGVVSGVDTTPLLHASHFRNRKPQSLRVSGSILRHARGRTSAFPNRQVDIGPEMLRGMRVVPVNRRDLGE
jgi:hypothetical protein